MSIEETVEMMKHAHTHTVYRYLIFLGPLDICFHVCASLPVQLALYTVEEVGRAKKILSGVTAASHLYPDSLLAMAVVGLLKGESILYQTH